MQTHKEKPMKKVELAAWGKMGRQIVKSLLVGALILGMGGCGKTMSGPREKEEIGGRVYAAFYSPCKEGVLFLGAGGGLEWYDFSGEEKISIPNTSQGEGALDLIHTIGPALYQGKIYYFQEKEQEISLMEMDKDAQNRRQVAVLKKEGYPYIRPMQGILYDHGQVYLVVDAQTPSVEAKEIKMDTALWAIDLKSGRIDEVTPMVPRKEGTLGWIGSDQKGAFYRERKLLDEGLSFEEFEKLPMDAAQRKEFSYYGAYENSHSQTTVMVYDSSTHEKKQLTTAEGVSFPMDQCIEGNVIYAMKQDGIYSFEEKQGWKKQKEVHGIMYIQGVLADRIYYGVKIAKGRSHEFYDLKTGEGASYIEIPEAPSPEAASFIPFFQQGEILVGFNGKDLFSILSVKEFDQRQWEKARGFR